MAEKHFIVVVYDISNDKRRTKLHNKLKDFGSPIQYSVFECLLTNSEISKMKQEVRKITRPRLDHVRFYNLCTECKGKIEIIGRSEVTSEVDIVVVG
jgi:CRISPR-associated protein Cas2